MLAKSNHCYFQDPVARTGVYLHDGVQYFITFIFEFVSEVAALWKYQANGLPIQCIAFACTLVRASDFPFDVVLTFELD